MKRMIMAALAATVCGTVFGGALTEKIRATHKVTRVDAWYGGQRTVFDFEGFEAWVVEPPAGVQPAKGMPWTWTMQWKTAFVPRTSVPRLLQAGYHHVTIDTFARHMDEKGLEVSKKFQDFLVGELGFAPKARLIGMSWGGFFSIRYASTYPDQVLKIYLDAPLLNFNGFEQHVPADWGARAPADNAWTDSPEMPVNRAAPIAKAGIPILLLYGGKDTVVPPSHNCKLFIPRFKAAGGDIKVVCRGSYEHHPHGVEVDENTIIDFFR